MGLFFSISTRHHCYIPIRTLFQGIRLRPLNGGDKPVFVLIFKGTTVIGLTMRV